MTYDYDVCIIGGGLAGMSGAIRARWVKSYKALCCSAAILECSMPGLGGLAGWKSSLITGPSFKLSGKGLVARLTNDVKKLNIPIIRSSVVKIKIDKDIKVLTTDTGRRIRSLALIIATGFKPLSNEYNYLDKGLFITYMGYEFLDRAISRLLSRNSKKTVAIIGNEKAFNLRRLVRQGNDRASTIKYIIDCDRKRAVPKGIKDKVIFGKVVKYFGGEKLKGLLVSGGATQKRVSCDAAILDYNSYEIRPCFDIKNPGIKRSGRGFIRVDREMRTNIPGVFAAGDITGLYASSSKSMTEGIIAGFSAYRYVFEKKLGAAPSLFAYAPQDFIIPPGFKELPALRLSLKPKAIGRKKEIEGALKSPGVRSMRKGEFISALDGSKDIKEILKPFPANDRKTLMKLLRELIEKKLLTLHR